MQAQRLAAAAGQRYSCRSYTADVPPNLDQLAPFLTDGFEPFPHNSEVRFHILDKPAVIQQILKGPWGPVSRLLLMAVRSDQPHYLEALGYAGQQLILEATALDIQTCWVAGMCDLKQAARHFPGLDSPWSVQAVSPLGCGTSSAKTGMKQKLFKFLSAQRGQRHGLDVLMHPTELASLPPVLVNAIQAAAKAPSALNRQPWRYALRGTELIVSSTQTAPQRTHPSRLDLGIAMLEFTAAVRAQGQDGHWQPRQADANPVAAFVLSA